MDELNEPLQAIFAEHVDTVYRSLDVLHQSIHDAVAILCESLLDERKILICGSGSASALAQTFCCNLLGQGRIERPGLPVIVIGSDAAMLNSIADSYGFADTCSRQILALGQSGDTLVLVVGQGTSAGALPGAIQAAHARGMRIVAFTAADDSTLGAQLAMDDIELNIPAENPMRISECQLLLLDCISTLIENTLFGDA